MADPDWGDFPEVVDPILGFELISESEEEEEILVPNPPLEQNEEPMAAGLDADPVAGQLMAIEEHNTILEDLAHQALEEIEAAETKFKIAEGLLEAERNATTRLRTLLQHTQEERQWLQVQLFRATRKFSLTLEGLERRVTRYPVEEGRLNYVMDRSVICHMIWEAYLAGRDV